MIFLAKPFYFYNYYIIIYIDRGIVWSTITKYTDKSTLT